MFYFEICYGRLVMAGGEAGTPYLGEMFVNQLLRNVFRAGAILAVLVESPQLGNARRGVLAGRRIHGGCGGAQSLAEVLADLWGEVIVLFQILGIHNAPPSLAGISGQRTENNISCAPPTTHSINTQVSLPFGRRIS